MLANLAVLHIAIRKMREYAPHEDAPGGPRTATISKTPPDLVSGAPAGSAVAQQPRSVPHLGGGKRAPVEADDVDADRRGDALLRTFSRPFLYRGIAG